MNKNSVKVIGIKDESRKDTDLSYVNQVEGLKDILNRDFVDWSNFDIWESISVQQWIFSRALDVYRGKRITIKCDCCEYIGYLQKSAYMIEKVVNEILLAKERRDRDGIYSA